MHREELVAKLKKVARIAAIVGGVLGLLCHFMPPQYRVVCQTIADVCRGS